MKKKLIPYFAHELFGGSSKLSMPNLQNSSLCNSNSFFSLTFCFFKNCYPKIAKPLHRLSICLVILILLFFLSACGRKMDPTLEDYLPPEPVERLNLSATYDKILISWSYPEKAKAKIESFLIERENKGEKKTLGYYDKNTTSLEDKNFTLGEIYRYRIFAIRPKGIYSKPTEAVITPLKLNEVENLQHQVTPQGVMFSWKIGDSSIYYNIYRINQKGERVKIGSTDKNFFLDALIYSTINVFTTPSINYVITTSIYSESTSIESKGIYVTIPIDSFTPSKPEEVFWTINEQGVYLSWKEVSEKWIRGYKIYRKSSAEKDFKLIGETMIPLFCDFGYNSSTIKSPIYYRINTVGPIKESEPFEIKAFIEGR